MKLQAEINDWFLVEDLRADHKIMLLTVIDRLNPKHRPLLQRMRDLAKQFNGDVIFRMIDVAENPSIKRILKLRKMPGVIVYSNGQEHKRWSGPIQDRWVDSALGNLWDGLYEDDDDEPDDEVT